MDVHLHKSLPGGFLLPQYAGNDSEASCPKEMVLVFFVHFSLPVSIRTHPPLIRGLDSL
jgi:hypothetical protein